MAVHMDFDVFWHSTRALWEGRSLYFDTGGPDSSTNPPFWTVLISPLGLLKPLTAYRSFVLITVLASVISLAWMAGELRMRRTASRSVRSGSSVPRTMSRAPAGTISRRRSRA